MIPASQSTKDPFHIRYSVLHKRFNPDHPNVSAVHTNVNLDLGPSHWKFRKWNPTFGDINRYTITDWVGCGRYSDVFLALRDGKDKCAIKLLKPINTDRVRRELKILTILQGHPVILELWDIVIDGKMGIPSMVTEFVPNVHWRGMFANMTLDAAKFYIYRVIQALAHTHAKGIMHRDVKPLNILCEDPFTKVTLADWGLAEFYHPMRKYSIHVATRFYKSPEILLGYEYYDYSLDMWSVGVMLLEILTLKVHIFDGIDDAHQIDAIAEITGGQPIIDFAEKYRIPVSPALKERLSVFPGIPYERLVSLQRRKFKDKRAIDLVKKLLTIDHKQRISAQDALEHPFFERVRQADAKAEGCHEKQNE